MSLVHWILSSLAETSQKELIISKYFSTLPLQIVSGKNPSMLTKYLRNFQILMKENEGS